MFLVVITPIDGLIALLSFLTVSAIDLRALIDCLSLVMASMVTNLHYPKLTSIFAINLSIMNAFYSTTFNQNSNYPMNE